MNVLIVDNDTSVRESLAKVLKGAGYQVTQAANGLEALEQFENTRVDLLLLDIGLPIRSGWEAFEQITHLNPVLPIIIITGQNDQFDQAVAAGAGAFMEKPLDAPTLLETIAELLTESKQARLRRVCGYSKDTRYVPATSRLFIQNLRERYAVARRMACSNGWIVR